MPGLVPGTHVFERLSETWMAGTGPAMTWREFCPLIETCYSAARFCVSAAAALS
jgi:hypothetical protein